MICNYNIIKSLKVKFAKYINGVNKVTVSEPCDKKTIANLGSKYNVYHRLVLLMKLNTQIYYNLRIILGYNIN